MECAMFNEAIANKYFQIAEKKSHNKIVDVLKVIQVCVKKQGYGKLFIHAKLSWKPGHDSLLFLHSAPL